MGLGFFSKHNLNTGEIEKELIIEKEPRRCKTIYREGNKIVKMEHVNCGCGEVEDITRGNYSEKDRQHKTFDKMLTEVGL